MIFCHEGE